MIKNLLPEIFLASATLFNILVFSLGNISKETFFKLSLFTILFVLVLIIISPGNYQAYSSSMIVIDKINNYMKFIISATAIFILIMAKTDIDSGKLNFEFCLLIAFALLGMMIMLSANNFISLYLAFELQSLCLYSLAAFDRDNSKSSEAGIKYFILGAIASGFLLFGISLIYGFTGSVDFSTIRDYLSNSNNEIVLSVLIGLIMIIIALAFKIAAAPFHIWSPDVYQGSPLIVTALLSTFAKAASIFLLMKLLTTIFNNIFLVYQWKQIIITISALSMTVGAVGALVQDKVKRILAYSSISHVGYILLGLSSADISASNIIINYIIIYIITNLGLFAFLNMTIKKDDFSINDFIGISKSHPLYSACITILILSLAGIPPMAGFFAKFYIFKIALSNKLYILTIIAALNSVIAAYYYLKIIKSIYFEDYQSSLILDINKENLAIFTFSALINLSFFYFIDKLY